MKDGGKNVNDAPYKKAVNKRIDQATFLVLRGPGRRLWRK